MGVTSVTPSPLAIHYAKCPPQSDFSATSRGVVTGEVTAQDRALREDYFNVFAIADLTVPRLKAVDDGGLA